MAQELSKYSQSVPDYGDDKKERFGNLDASDMTIPRVKLMHSVSPELGQYEGIAKAGEFWHDSRHQSLGKELIGIPIICRKTQVLWAPRGDDRNILARAADGVHWDPPEGEFKVQFENNPATYTWKLAPTVAESGLSEFGSSRPGDKGSPPAATLTYEVLWAFPEQPELGQAIILNSRGAVKPAKDMFGVIDNSPRSSFYQVWSIKSVVAKNQRNNTFFNYQYTSVGYVAPEDGAKYRDMFKRFEHVQFRATDQRDDAGPLGGGSERESGPTERSAEDKF